MADQDAAKAAQKAIEQFNDLIIDVEATCQPAIVALLNNPDAVEFGESGAERDVKHGVWVASQESSRQEYVERQSAISL